MAICDFCEKEVSAKGGNPADACEWNKFVYYPNGDCFPSSTLHFNEPNGRCHDCNIKHGGKHHPGCDAERCPKCGGQLISCGCLDQEEGDD